MTQDEVGSVLSTTQQWTGVDGGPSVQGTGRGHLWGHYAADHSGPETPAQEELSREKGPRPPHQWSPGSSDMQSLGLHPDPLNQGLHCMGP